MTLREAIANKVGRVRDPNWNPQAYFKLEYDENGHLLPWATLVDPIGQRALGIEVGSQKECLLLKLPEWGNDTVEEYTGEPLSGF